jgi:hypothetical protein
VADCFAETRVYSSTVAGRCLAFPLGSLMSVFEAIRDAEAILPGTPAPDGAEDPRWQAIIAISEYIKTDPDEVWPFIARWGTSTQGDLRDAIATCLLEHVLEHHFERIFPRVQRLAEADPTFADTFRRCWKFGQSQLPENARRFDALRSWCSSRSKPNR